MKPEYKNFSGYILAGGKSSRMGQDKAFLEINGKTFLQSAVDTIKPICEERVKVVLNKKQTHFIEKLPKGLPYIFDIYENRGPVGGIHAALKDAETEYTLILPVDLPFLTVDFLSRLAERAWDSKASVVLPKHSIGKTEQLVTVYKTKNSVSILGDLLSDESKSVSVLNFINHLSSTVTLDLDRDDSIFENVNKPEDYGKINR